MIYTTTKCPHCGFRTRNRETGVQKVELGQTIACCPRCGKVIIDPIDTEYEFMTDNERKKWSTNHLASAEKVRGIIMLILGLIFFIIGFVVGDVIGVIFALLFGGGFIVWGINKISAVGKINNYHVGEQIIYESLLRTSNEKYVDLLKKYYKNKRTYRPIENRNEIISEYEQYSTKDVHESFERDFLDLLNIIENKNEVDAKKSKTSTSYVNSGAIVGGIMAVPSAIIENKQNKEIAKKNRTRELNAKEKISSVNKTKLKELKELYEEGLITEKEYAKKRKQIIDDI